MPRTKQPLLLGRIYTLEIAPGVILPLVPAEDIDGTSLGGCIVYAFAPTDDLGRLARLAKLENLVIQPDVVDGDYFTKGFCRLTKWKLVNFPFGDFHYFTHSSQIDVRYFNADGREIEIKTPEPLPRDGFWQRFIRVFRSGDSRQRLPKQQTGVYCGHAGIGTLGWLAKQVGDVIGVKVDKDAIEDLFYEKYSSIRELKSSDVNRFESSLTIVFPPGSLEESTALDRGSIEESLGTLLEVKTLGYVDGGGSDMSGEMDISVCVSPGCNPQVFAIVRKVLRSYKVAKYKIYASEPLEEDT